MRVRGVSRRRRSWRKEFTHLYPAVRNLTPALVFPGRLTSQSNPTLERMITMIQEESRYQRPTAPRTIGGVLDDAITLYRRSIGKVWPLTLAAAVVVAVPAIFMRLQLAGVQTQGPQAALAAMQSPTYWLSYLAIMLIYIVVYGALLLALDGYARGGTLAVGDALQGGLKLLPRMLVVSILFMIIVMVGMVLFIIPGIYLWGIFQLAFVALVVEQSGAFDSFGISRRLIKGHWWRSVTIIGVAFIIVLVFSLIVGLANGVTVALFGIGSWAAVAVQTILGGALNIVLIPLFPCFLLAMYYDLKLRHEGGDLSARVDALAAR